LGRDGFPHGADIDEFSGDTCNAGVPGLVKPPGHLHVSTYSCPDCGADDRLRFILSLGNDPKDVRTNTLKALDDPEVVLQSFRAFKYGNETGDLAIPP